MTEAHFAVNRRVSYLRLRQRVGMLTPAERAELETSFVLLAGDGGLPLAVPAMQFTRKEYIKRYCDRVFDSQTGLPSDDDAPSDAPSQMERIPAPRRFDAVDVDDPAHPAPHPSVPGHAPAPLRGISR